MLYNLPFFIKCEVRSMLMKEYGAAVEDIERRKTKECINLERKRNSIICRLFKHV